MPSGSGATGSNEPGSCRGGKPNILASLSLSYMQVECPYCRIAVDVTGLERHVRMSDGDGHGAHGSVPFDDVDNPWHLRLDFSAEPAEGRDEVDDEPPVDVIVDRSRRGWCPRCEMGILGFKGGNGFLSRGRRRLACMNCGWESPEWVRIRS